jgi:NADH-quinone oxidoreductase subunit G
MSAVARRADVVLPIAPAVEKAGSYVDWEGRVRPFETILRSGAMTDARVLDALATEMGAALDCADIVRVREQLAVLAHLPLPGTGDVAATPAVAAAIRPSPPRVSARDLPELADGEAILATWHHLLDNGSLQDGDGYLAGTARTPVVRLSKSTAADLGVNDGDPVTVGTGRGAVTLPALVTDMVDRVVWLPTNSPGSTVRRTLGATEGAVVSVTASGGGS